MSKPTQFELCMDRGVPTPEKAQCKKLLDVTVNARIRKTNWNPIEGQYFNVNGPRFFVRLPKEDSRILTSSTGQEPWIDIRPETHEQLFARHLWSWVGTAGTRDCIVNQSIGDIWLISQPCFDVTTQHKHKHEPIASYYVPAEVNSEKLQTCIKIFSDPETSVWSKRRNLLLDSGGCGSPEAWFICAEPRGGIAKQPDTGNGCTVHAEFRPNFHISYQIRYRHLKDWKSIHDDVLQQLNTLMVIKEK